MQRHYFADKGPYSQSYDFSSSHVWMWELNHKEGKMLKNWCFWTVVLEKTLESPLDCKEIKPVNPKGNQPWIFIRRTDLKLKLQYFWPPDAKSWLVRKDPDAGKDWRQEEKGTTDNETVGWNHRLNGCEFGQTLRDSEGQGSLACYSPWGHSVRLNLATEKLQQQQGIDVSFPGWLSGKESACNVGSVPGSGRSPGEGNDNSLQHSCLGNPMDRGAWWAIVMGSQKSRTQLSD